MLVLLPFAAAAANIAACPGETTTEVNACLDARLKQADARLNRYYQVALKRIAKEAGNEPARSFVQAERSWIAYRDAECGSVYDRYKGTIKASVELNCRIRLTDIRTYVIWRDWLTYPDSTPSLLPRPDLQSDLSGR